jgi:hypothetical protein
MQYRVKFISLQEQTIDKYDYESLFDAIRVAKETNIGPDRLYTEAIPDDKFNEEFLSLLTLGFIYVGPKTEKYPEGNTMIQLVKVNEREEEFPVYSNVFHMPGALPVDKHSSVPDQREEPFIQCKKSYSYKYTPPVDNSQVPEMRTQYEFKSPVADIPAPKCNTVSEMYTSMQMINPPVAD